MRNHPKVLVAGILAVLGCASPGSEEPGGTPLARKPSESLLGVACRLTDGMVSDPRVARAIAGGKKAGGVDDRRAVVRLEDFDDFTGWAVDLEELREGLLLHLLGTVAVLLQEHGEVDHRRQVASRMGRDEVGHEVLFFSGAL